MLPAVERATQAASRYINKRVSLLSTSDVRYNGELYTVDPAETSIALKHVNCLGTQDRRKGNEAIAPSECTYEFIIFRAVNIKSLQLDESDRRDLTNEILEPLRQAAQQQTKAKAKQNEESKRRVGYSTRQDYGYGETSQYPTQQSTTAQTQQPYYNYSQSQRRSHGGSHGQYGVSGTNGRTRSPQVGSGGGGGGGGGTYGSYRYDNGPSQQQYSGYGYQQQTLPPPQPQTAPHYSSQQSYQYPSHSRSQQSYQYQSHSRSQHHQQQQHQQHHQQSGYYNTQQQHQHQQHQHQQHIQHQQHPSQHQQHQQSGYDMRNTYYQRSNYNNYPNTQNVQRNTNLYDNRTRQSYRNDNQIRGYYNDPRYGRRNQIIDRQTQPYQYNRQYQQSRDYNRMNYGRQNIGYQRGDRNDRNDRNRRNYNYQNQNQTDSSLGPGTGAFLDNRVRGDDTDLTRLKTDFDFGKAIEQDTFKAPLNENENNEQESDEKQSSQSSNGDNKDKEKTDKNELNNNLQDKEDENVNVNNDENVVTNIFNKVENENENEKKVNDGLKEDSKDVTFDELTEKLNKLDIEPKYNKLVSFFDNLPQETRKGAIAAKKNDDEDRATDAETFGDIAKTYKSRHVQNRLQRKQPRRQQTGRYYGDSGRRDNPRQQNINYGQRRSGNYQQRSQGSYNYNSNYGRVNRGFDRNQASQSSRWRVK